jgi:hypothetical protein
MSVIVSFLRESVVIVLALLSVALVAGFTLSKQLFCYHVCLKRRLRERSSPPAVRRDLLEGRIAFLSPQAHPSLGECAGRIAERLRAGDYSSVEVTRAFLSHARRVNMSLNAAVNWRESEALAEAAAADLQLASARVQGTSNLPPFLGVPCSVKEAIACTGFPLTSGLLARRNSAPCDEDATSVRRYRAAGFIVLCQTNVSELCMCECGVATGRLVLQ